MAAASDQRETVGEYTTLKPSVAAVQPTKIVNHSEEQEDSRHIASGIARRHASDPEDFELQPPFDQDDVGDDRKSRKNINNRLKSGLMIAGVVTAVIGALCMAISKMRQKDVRV